MTGRRQQSHARGAAGAPASAVAKTLRGKRSFDVVVSALGLVLLAPLMAGVAVAVRFSSSGPVLFRGKRVGLLGADFEILKFRTMWDRSYTQLTTAQNDQRVTRVGRWLRRYKLDELPQLVNVLRGDMSLVGPRPEFRQWVELYDEREREILRVRPGITDFASLEFVDLAGVVGEHDADDRYLSEAFARKNALRLHYVETMSWATDVKLLASTVVAIVHKR